MKKLGVRLLEENFWVMCINEGMFLYGCTLESGRKYVIQDSLSKFVPLSNGVYASR